LMAEEKNFENKVKKFLIDSGCWVLKYWGGAAYTKGGIPDLLVCCQGLFLGVELKSTAGKPSQLQMHQLRKIRESGGIAILLYPDDFERFKEYIGLLKTGHLTNQYGGYPFKEWNHDKE